jgi:hypothetical protein
LKRYWISVSNSTTVTLERYIGFASDPPSMALLFPNGSENMVSKTEEFAAKRHWGTRKRRFSAFTEGGKTTVDRQERRIMMGSKR